MARPLMTPRHTDIFAIYVDDYVAYCNDQSNDQSNGKSVSKVEWGKNPLHDLLNTEKVTVWPLLLDGSKTAQYNDARM